MIESPSLLTTHFPTFSRSLQSVQANSTAGNKNPAPTPDQYVGDYQHLPRYVQGAFFDWMVNRSQTDPIKDAEFERKILDYLDVLADSELAGANLIPRVPSVMVELLKRMHEENVSGLELSRIISKDVVLVAAILNEVNSSYYNLTEKIHDLSQAILLLGHNRLRMLLAKLSFTPVFNEQLGPYTKMIAAIIWDVSQKRALVAYMLAKQKNVDPFSAFLAGLMQDVGLMVALRVFDRSSRKGQLPLSHSFRRGLGQRAMLLSTRIAQVWSVPELVIKAIEAQGIDRTGMAKLPIGRVIRKADYIAKCCVLIEAGQLAIDVEQLRSAVAGAEVDCLCALMEGQISIANVL